MLTSSWGETERERKSEKDRWQSNHLVVPHVLSTLQLQQHITLGEYVCDTDKTNKILPTNEFRKFRQVTKICDDNSDT